MDCTNVIGVKCFYSSMHAPVHVSHLFISSQRSFPLTAEVNSRADISLSHHSIVKMFWIRLHLYRSSFFLFFMTMLSNCENSFISGRSARRDLSFSVIGLGAVYLWSLCYNQWSIMRLFELSLEIMIHWSEKVGSYHLSCRTAWLLVPAFHNCYY